MFLSLLFYANDRLQQATSDRTRPLHQGDTGNAVKCLQLALVALGYPLPRSVPAATGCADGIFGTETLSAVTRFQTTNGLRVDGLVGRMTLARLDKQLLMGERDPLHKAVLGCRDSGARLLSALSRDTPCDAERLEFQKQVGKLNQFLLGDPLRQRIKIQSILR